MTKIFISYRRDDSGYVAGMLAQRLQGQFGKDAVFLDVDNIPFGLDFRDHIARAVGQCDVLLALIGDSWIAATSADGQRRIDSPTDFVRLELEAALTRTIPVVPVLVDKARMPTEGELPASLHGLVYRNAAEIRAGRDMQHHLNVLTEAVESLVRTHRAPESDTAARNRSIAVDVPRPEHDTPINKPVDVDEPLSVSRSDKAASASPVSRPAYWRALLLNVLGGCGLFYADPHARRRWIYPSGILGSGAWALFAIMPSYGTEPMFFGTGETILFLSMVFAVLSYVASFVDVSATCFLRRRTNA
jgi:hypothetical protein